MKFFIQMLWEKNQAFLEKDIQEERNTRCHQDTNTLENKHQLLSCSLNLFRVRGKGDKTNKLVSCYVLQCIVPGMTK